MTLVEELAIGAVLLLLAFGGGYAYRAHQDAGAVSAAQTEIAERAALAVNAATSAADAKTQALQDAADKAASDLAGQLDQSRRAYAAELQAHAQDLRAHAVCTVPISDVGVLYRPAAVPGDSAVPALPGPAAGNPQRGAVAEPTGAVSAADIAATCEVARGAFERNSLRLAECVARYDACRGSAAIVPALHSP
jgi:adenosylmethionine-8-amino-7-oxononanoate aminotransferase